MAEFFAIFEELFWKIWNELYVYLCELMDSEVNEEWFAPLED